MQKYSFCLAALALFVGACSSDPSAQQIIDRSIAYHDPDGEWDSFSARLQFDEFRPNGPERNTTIWIDNSTSFFKIDRNGSEIHGVVADSCFIEKGKVDCDRAMTMRNYYTYLWGLPMKLKDPGTAVRDEVETDILNETPVYLVTVPYEQDTWTFYFSRNTYELLAYSFLKNDGSGEYIIPDGVLSVGNIQILNNRSWYSLDSIFLGTDRLVNKELL